MHTSNRHQELPMAGDDDSDYDPKENKPSAPRRSSRERSSSTGSSEADRHRSRLPSSLPQIKGLLETIQKQLQGHDIHEEVSLRVIRASLTLQADYLKKVQKVGQK